MPNFTESYAYPDCGVSYQGFSKEKEASDLTR